MDGGRGGGTGQLTDVSWLSWEERATVELSEALHWMEVMGELWYLKWATKDSAWQGGGGREKGGDEGGRGE